MSDENASYVGNKAEPDSSKTDININQSELKTGMSGSPSSEGVSIDDESDEDSASSGDEVDDDTAESELKPYIFSSEGYAVEYMDGRGSQTDRGSSAGNMSARSDKAGSQTARGGQSQRSRLVVVASGLSLNITYEPPSPKFHQQCPGSSSYRLKLFKGTDFLYSVRGLPQQVKVHQSAYIVRWGPLELQYNSKHQLEMFTSAVKHVEMLYTPCGQTTARQTAAALRPSRTSAPLAPLDTKHEPQSSQRSSFGSPLPEVQSDAEQPTSVETAPASAGSMGDGEKAAARVPTGVSTSREEPSSETGGSSPLKSSWVWLGLGIAAVAFVTYTVFKTDMPASKVSRPVKAHEYKLHVVS